MVHDRKEVIGSEFDYTITLIHRRIASLEYIPQETE